MKILAFSMLAMSPTWCAPLIDEKDLSTDGIHSHTEDEDGVHKHIDDEDGVHNHSYQYRDGRNDNFRKNTFKLGDTSVSGNVGADKVSIGSRINIQLVADHEHSAGLDSSKPSEHQVSIGSKVNIEDVTKHPHSIRAPDPCYDTFADGGPCEAHISSWSYNQETGKCEHFIFGGCEGNDNRFATSGECSERCEETGKPPDPQLCIQVTVCSHRKIYPSPCDAPSFPPPCYDYITTGSKSCICLENNPCSHGGPLTDSSGSPLVCSRSGRTSPMPSKKLNVCPSGSYCNFSFLFDAFDEPALCCPNAPPKREGETCGSCFCPPTYSAGYCEDGLTCIKDKRIPDAPGICTRSDSENPCSYGSPLADSSGVKLFCGRGPNRVECPKGSSCLIQTTDQYAVCCPEVPKLTDRDAVKKVASGNRMFACSLYDSLKKQDVGKNLLMSPYSASSVMAMAYIGAVGDTSKQIMMGMYFPEMDILETGYYDVIRVLKGNNHLDTANNIFIQNDFELLYPFQRSMKEYFHSKVEQLDFSDFEAARNKINNWVGEETNDKIENLIGEGLLSASTRMVLVNAIYFKGYWVHQFAKEDTHEESFFVNKDKSVKVQMMHSHRGEFRISKSSDFAAYTIELPYRGEHVSMYIVLPADKNGLEEVERKLCQENVEEVISKTDAQEKMKFSLALPKFKVEKTIEMTKHLQNLGMKDMFDMKADFSGINGKRNLYVTAAVQKTFLEVDELGSEAAAASGVVVGLKSLYPHNSFELKCDHPFLFFIKDKLTDMILFRGRVMDPTSVSKEIWDPPNTIVNTIEDIFFI